MKLINASHEVLTPINGEAITKHIEVCGRTCYKSESKITEDSSRRFVRGIIKSGHESVIEHFNISVRFICDRGIMAELTRHRLAAFSVESTRYVNYKKREIEFILPSWWDNDLVEIPDSSFKRLILKKVMETNLSDMYNSDIYKSYKAHETWYDAMYKAECNYIDLINYGWKPEQARSVLPNSLKTEIVMTCNLRSWIHILDQRCSKRCHPQMRELMLPLLKELNMCLPDLFNPVYIKYFDN